MFGTVLTSLRVLTNRQRLLLTLLTLLRILNNFLDLLGIALIGLTSSLAFGLIDAPKVLVDLGLASEELLLLLLISATVSFTLKTVVGTTLSKVTMTYLAKIETIYSHKIASSIFEESLSELKDHSVSEIEWAVLRSTQRAFTGILGHATNLATDFLLAVLIFGFFLATDSGLAIAVTLYLSLILGLFHLISRRFVSRQGELFAEGTKLFNETLKSLTEAYREIVVFSKTKIFLERMRQHRGMVAQAEAMHLYLAPIPRYIIELALIVGAVGFLMYFLAFEEADNDFSVLGIFLAGSLRLVSAILPLQRSFQFIRFEAPQARAATDILGNISNPTSTLISATNSGASPEKVVDNESATSCIAVTFSSVSFRYARDKTEFPAISNFSFSLRSGEFAAIVGPSGSGKSTLVDILLGLNRPTEGTVLCSGISPLELRNIRPGLIGYVPQRVGMVSGSIAENIAFGEPIDEIDEPRLKEAISKAELSDFVDSLPHGVHTSTGKQRDSLSGGQIQRVGLARALYFAPKLLVLDEPTSALDPRTEDTIVKTLQRLRSEFTLVVVTHRLGTVKRADSVLFLEGGKLEGHGTFADLRKENSLFSKFADVSLEGD